MPNWGARVKVSHGQGCRIDSYTLDTIMEVLAEHAGIAGSTASAISIRLFVTAADRANASGQARDLALAALAHANVAHQPDSVVVLTVDPMDEFQRDFPAPK